MGRPTMDWVKKPAFCALLPLSSAIFKTWKN
jgi:hypothetical protein